MISYSKAKLSDLEEVKNIFLEILNTDSSAFSSTRMDFEMQSKAWWQNYLQKYIFNPNNLLMLAKNDSKIIGLMGFVRKFGKKVEHSGNLYWMWVDKNYRGNGVGQQLLTKIINFTKTLPGLKKIELTVYQNQFAAVNLYEKCGFEQVGVKKQDVLEKGEYLDCIIMEKFLNE